MTDLSDFGCFESTPPPRIQKETPVETRQTYPHTQVGYVGPVPNRRSMGFVKVVSRDEHRFRELEKENGGAYAISDDAFRRLTDVYGVDVILVSEVGTETVYEWKTRQWFGNDVPVKYLHDDEDPQTYAPVGTAVPWNGHATDVFIDEDVDVTSVDSS